MEQDPLKIIRTLNKTQLKPVFQIFKMVRWFNSTNFNPDLFCNLQYSKMQKLFRLHKNNGILPLTANNKPNFCPRLNKS